MTGLRDEFREKVKAGEGWVKGKNESSLFTDSSAGFYLPTYRFVPGNGTKLPWQRAIFCHNQAVNGIRQRMPIFHYTFLGK